MLRDISKEQIENWALREACSGSENVGELHHLAARTVNGEIDFSELRRQIASVLYKTGCIGLKTSAFTQTRWADSDSYTVSAAEIADETNVTIHPGLWRVLGVSQFEGDD